MKPKMRKKTITFPPLVHEKREGATHICTGFRTEEVHPAVVDFYERRFRAKHGRKTARSIKLGGAALAKDFEAIHEREWLALRVAID